MRQRRRGLLVGIIPAYAGNTGIWSDIVRFRRDHPRICGEHHPAHLVFPTLRGSSPHMRGTHRCGSGQRHCKGIIPHMRGTRDDQRYANIVQGIIPAYAGNTEGRAVVDGHERDHPRICGEHVIALRGGLCQLGSSPHMRGTPVLPLPLRLPVGIIPAYAGNTTLTAIACTRA